MTSSNIGKMPTTTKKARATHIFGPLPRNMTFHLLSALQKLQVGFKRVEDSKKRFSWKMGFFIILLTISGLLYLDVTENGKGSFPSMSTCYY
jgi:hypothetical protein